VLLLFSIPLPLSVPLYAAEVEGVTLEDRIRVDGQELRLNGAALRTRVIFKVYVAGLRANSSEAQVAVVKAQMDELMAMIRAVGQAKKGMRIVLDYEPSAVGTTLFVDGVAQGRPMSGEAFYQALLRIWLGDDPVQLDLKEALLGGEQ